MARRTLWVVSLAIGVRCLGGADFPKAEIRNGEIRATVYLPDKAKGFYRSTRFDWSGMIGSLKYRGHEFYGPWFSKIEENVYDYDYDNSEIVAAPFTAGSGLAEEYQTSGKALGYYEAKGGETFIKIGVGVLRKPANEEKYDHSKPYEIVDGGKWTVHKTADSVEFVQEISNPTTKYGYRYTKILRLDKSKPVLEIEHRLRNIGTREIESRMYNHNFLTLDKQPPGPDLVTTTAYPIEARRPPTKGLGEIRGNQLVYLKTLEGKDRMTASLGGFGASAKDFDFRVENRRLGAGVRITGDRPLANVSVWSIRTVFALEPFVSLKISPGEETQWKFIYEYYTTDGASK